MSSQDTSQALTVRLLAAEDDAVALGQMVVAAYVAIPGGPGRAEMGDYVEQLADVAARAEHATVVVAELGQRIVGCVTYVPDHRNRFAEHDDPAAGAFRMLAVDPAVQGSGAGRALVAWCIARARADDKARLVIHSGRWMQRAHGLYDRFGFVRRPDLDWWPQPGVELLGYSLELD